jgi:hypothetical protein
MGREKEIFSSYVAMALTSKRPIHMGMAFFSCMSFNMTMGVFVSGSMVSPDTFILINMRQPLSLSHQASPEGMLVRFCNRHRHGLAHEFGIATKIHDLIGTGSPYNIITAIFANPFDKELLNATYASLISFETMFFLKGLQCLQSLSLYIMGNLLSKTHSRRTRTFRIPERKRAIEHYFFHQVKG